MQRTSKTRRRMRQREVPFTGRWSPAKSRPKRKSIPLSITSPVGTLHAGGAPRQRIHSVLGTQPKVFVWIPHSAALFEKALPCHGLQANPVPTTPHNDCLRRAYKSRNQMKRVRLCTLSSTPTTTQESRHTCRDDRLPDACLSCRCTRESSEYQATIICSFLCGAPGSDEEISADVCRCETPANRRYGTRRCTCRHRWPSWLLCILDKRQGTLLSRQGRQRRSTRHSSCCRVNFHAPRRGLWICDYHTEAPWSLVETHAAADTVWREGGRRGREKEVTPLPN